MREEPRHGPEPGREALPKTFPKRHPATSPGMLTSDIPEEWRAGRFVTLTVGGGVDMAETHPTEANPEARG